MFWASVPTRAAGHPFTQNTVTLRASYIGYEPANVTITITNIGGIAELTFRLQPKPIQADELIITGGPAQPLVPSADLRY